MATKLYGMYLKVASNSKRKRTLMDETFSNFNRCYNVIFKF